MSQATKRMLRRREIAAEAVRLQATARWHPDIAVQLTAIFKLGYLQFRLPVRTPLFKCMRKASKTSHTSGTFWGVRP